jgi:predicted metal-dependent enzyme (double-stranded beta helix superfamily)
MQTSAPIGQPLRGSPAEESAQARALRELERWQTRLRFDDLHELGEVYAHGSERSYLRLPTAVGCEAWLICWPPGSKAPLHDHGGAAGFASVLSGELCEWLYPNGRNNQAGALTQEHCVERIWQSGAIIRVDPHACHEVRNLTDNTVYSLHVYQPRLQSMTYYERTEAGELRAVRSEPVI